MLESMERLVRPADLEPVRALRTGWICPRCGCPCGHDGPAACEPCRPVRWWSRRYARR